MVQTARSTHDETEVPAETGACPIDMEHLLHYTMGDESLAREVLGLFCTQGRLYLQQLSAASGPQERKNAAHTLKGSAQGVGAHQVATLCLELEQLSETVDDAGWDAALRKLNTVFGDAENFIQQQS